VGRINVEGDDQADRLGHGGEHRAVFVYQIESYRYWQQQLGRDDFSYGQVGENFTVEGLADDEVCVGDRYRIGDALFEVTQPRVTCYRVGIRLEDPRMPSLLVAHQRPGFYVRVLEGEVVEAGQEIVKVASGRLEGVLPRAARPRVRARAIGRPGAGVGGAPGRADQRRRRRHAGDGDAARAGGSGL
jgi:MOSC domain-containing protein YiiM